MRIPREIEAGTTYHVISRFVDERFLLRDDDDRDLYLRLLGHAVEYSDWLCVAYAMMSNHIHLDLFAGEAPLGDLLKRVNSPFARLLNERHHGRGPVFAERADAWAIRPAHEAKLIAYIHNNPVRARVVEHARDSSWTSHRAYVGLAARPKWLAVEHGFASCGVPPTEFDAWVESTVEENRVEGINAIQRAVHRRGAVEPGTPHASPTWVPLVARPHARVRPDPREVLAEVALSLGIEATRFAGRTPDKYLVDARRVTVQTGLAVGLTRSDMATALGLSRQAAAKLAAAELPPALRAVVAYVASRLTK